MYLRQNLTYYDGNGSLPAVMVRKSVSKFQVRRQRTHPFAYASAPSNSSYLTHLHVRPPRDQGETNVRALSPPGTGCGNDELVVSRKTVDREVWTKQRNQPSDESLRLGG